ncbi:uncharacterized protein LOC129792431 [Lutzomyia longipalpis]|uniref:uncharacterized protein LOC129792431 n=1 Tax=Lutzomyia longipalpis TaxID=7200 RepID=UPI002483D4A7|nr:uncharacterized protein LOC129792431 [Lutzomyia longipalpis]
MACDIQEIMVAIFSCYAVLCILVAPVWSSPVPSSKVADRKTLNPVRNAAVASLSRARQIDEGWSTDRPEEATTAAPELLSIAKPGASVATNILTNLMQHNNAVHMAFEGAAPEENYANLPYTPIIDYAFMKPDNATTANATANWQDTLANLYKNPAFAQNGGLVKLPPVKIVGAGTESKFPFILEGVAQRIQAMFSTYAHEDLSRPATWDSNSTLLTNRTTTTTPKTTLKTTLKSTLQTTRKPAQITTKTTKTTKSSTRYPNKNTSTTLRTTLQTTRKPLTQTPTKTTKITKTTLRVTRVTTRPTSRATTRATSRATTPKPTYTTTKIFPSTLLVASAESELSEESPNRSEEIDVTFSKPISVENDTYIYVGEGDDDEFDRGIHRKKQRV